MLMVEDKGNNQMPLSGRSVQDCAGFHLVFLLQGLRHLNLKQLLQQ